MSSRLLDLPLPVKSPGDRGGIMLGLTIGALAAVLVDLLVMSLLIAAGLPLPPAHVASFVVAAVTFGFVVERWTFRGVTERFARWRTLSALFTVAALALILRGGLMVVALDVWGISQGAATILGAVAAGAVLLGGSVGFVLPVKATGPIAASDWRLIAASVVSYVLILRLIFLPLVDLIPEEAYYWNYAQHLDFGYLDHPPMVAWLIHLTTSIVGDTTTGVRLGAYLCWLVTAFFSFRLTQRLFGTTEAMVAVMLLATLPFYFSAGFIMMPDAAMMLCWSAALFFLERALLGQRRSAWLGVGIAIGLGMLSKYSIALLGLATLMFVVVDRDSRRWLLRPEPYLAAVLALVLFAPVIWWNAVHDWVSFAFQSADRLARKPRFSTDALFAFALLILTPAGFAAAVMTLLPRRPIAAVDADPAIVVANRRRWLFLAIYTLVPLAVFVAFSVRHTVKLNWTAPVWLGVLPLIAASIVAGGVAGRVQGFIHRLWIPTIGLCLVVSGVLVTYLSLQWPTAGNTRDPIGLLVPWPELAVEVDRIVAATGAADGRPPLVVGMDNYFIASELAFYRDLDHQGVTNTTGRAVFGQASLMYNYWAKPAEEVGRTMILVSSREDAVCSGEIEPWFERMEPCQVVPLAHEGLRLKPVWYRIGYGFRNISAAPIPLTE